jgi:hypothetical protein
LVLSSLCSYLVNVTCPGCGVQSTLASKKINFYTVRRPFPLAFCRA